MYFLYSLGGVTFNKCWITLSILNCYSPNFQRFILMKNALNNQVGMLGDMYLWLVANLKQGVIYFIKQALPPNISARSVYPLDRTKWYSSVQAQITCANSTTTLQCTDISQLCALPIFLQLGVPLICSALSYRLSGHSLVLSMIACGSVH